MADYGVLAFLGESGGALNIGHSSTDDNLKDPLKKHSSEQKNKLLSICILH